MNNINKENECQFTHEDELKLHHLRAKKDWSEKQVVEVDSSTKGLEDHNNLPEPEKWLLSDSITLYDWQKECVNNWFNAKGKGTVKVVTGAGKTILALSTIQRLQNTHESDLHVAIIVPTIVLMEQWYEELSEKTNIPKRLIGRLGGGNNDNFKDGNRILLCVINSAQKKLPQMVSTCGCEDKLLLIIDECHRAGASIMSNIFKTKRKYSLGLSATPERENDVDMSDDEKCEDKNCILNLEDNYDDSLLGKELGAIVYEMTLDDAFKRGILPPYEIRHFGIPLSAVERTKYEKLTREIRDIKDKLWKFALSQNVFSDRDFNKWCNTNSGNQDTSRMKRMYLSKGRERKSLLYKADSRSYAAIKLLKKEFKTNPNARVILFHENINASMDLYCELIKFKINAVPENSKLSDSIRKNSIELFRRGKANVLVSVRSLIEGFNVPSADVGIVVASNTSPRQRIQTFGRLLRKHKTHSGEEKHSVINVLYIENTVDEIIYEKIDWDSLTGAERNIYFKWNPDPEQNKEPEVQESAPRNPLPSDIQIDVSTLIPGNRYSGKHEGRGYTADTDGNVYLEGKKERPIANPQSVPELLYKFKNGYGKFKVTPNNRYVLTNVFQNNEWIRLYITTLEEPFYLADVKENNNSNEIDLSKLQSGDEIQKLSLVDATEYIYKKKGGREFIVKKIKRGEIYAHTSENANDKSSGEQADKLINSLSITEKELGEKISKFKIVSDNIAVTLKSGKIFFISNLQHPLEFKE